MPAQIAIAYSPTATGGTIGTSNTGSFYLGNMNTRQWAGVVTATGGNTRFFASPDTSSGYVIALPYPQKPDGVTEPQFFRTATPSVALYTTLADWVLKHYTVEGNVVTTGTAAAPAGCVDVTTCQAALTSAGWVTTFGLTASINPPA